VVDREDQQQACLGMLNWARVAVITTRLARGTPRRPWT
jgi:hypothetical protein